MQRKYLFNFLRIPLFVVFFFGALNLYAQTSQYKRSKVQKPKASAPTTPSKEGEVAAKSKDNTDAQRLDVSDLETKYWSPKDTDFSVVQNRTYSKSGRFGLSATYGPWLNDTFNEGDGLSISLDYFFNERFGVEIQYEYLDLKDSESIDVFKNRFSSSGVIPDFNRPKSHYSVGMSWVPIYAKMSFLGKRILYYDFALVPSIGVTKYDHILDTGNKSSTAVDISLDVVQYFFINKNIAVRLDFKNRWYKEDILKYNTGLKDRDETKHGSLLLLGFTYYY